jgi:hypothetical protein
MIELASLSESDIGRWVLYRDRFDRIFVVYRCAGNWDEFVKYTGVATDPVDLHFLHDETNMNSPQYPDGPDGPGYAPPIGVQAYEETLRILTDQITRRNQLIAELCAALEMPFEQWTLQSELIQRAREAINGSD